MSSSNSKEKDSIKIFETTFRNNGYSVKVDSEGGRVSGQKNIDNDTGRVGVNVYFYKERVFYGWVDGEKKVRDTSPCLTMYASGPGLSKLGIANLELSSIKYPHEEDLEKLEDYLGCLLILLK